MIGFRKLDRVDLPLMHRWLNTPHVVEWWPDEALSLDEIVAKYSWRIDEKEDVRRFVVMLDDRPIGYIQKYPLGEFSAGIDLFIGEIAFLHRGFGVLIIRQFLNDIVFAEPVVESCIIDPSVSNRAAIRAYEKARFCFLKTEKNPGEAEAHQLGEENSRKRLDARSGESDVGQYRRNLENCVRLFVERLAA
jgi:RimJ/RimL family protein N-acetyltransferase